MTALDFRKLVMKQTVLLDGGMGSMLMAAGLKHGDLPESWNIVNADKLAEVHRAYLEAGADVIQTNTFGASRKKLGSSRAGKDLDVVEVNEKAVEIVRSVVGDFGAPAKFVAGDIGPTGEFFAPMGTLTEESALETFKEQAEVLAKAGVDLFLIETMLDLNEAVAAVRAVREVSDLPVIAEMTFQKKPVGYFTIVGDTPEKVSKALVEAGADVVGSNCTLATDEMLGLAQEFRQHTDAPLLFQPNAGSPQTGADGKATYAQTASEFADGIEEIIEAGANLVGGCCGTNPEFIRAVRERLG